MTLKCVPDLARYLQTAEEVEKTIRGWRMSTEDANKLRFVFANKDGFFTTSQLQRLLFMGTPRDHVLDLMEAQHDDRRVFLKNWEVPTFPVSGNDLMAAGVKPGPQMGKMLQDLKAEFADDEYKTTKEELLRMVAQVQEVENG